MLYFGYGSLVNRQTRSAAEQSHRATLNGWQRQWRHRANRPWQRSDLHAGFWVPPGASDQASARAPDDGHGVCALTLARLAGSSIDGVLVEIDPADLPTLDQREAGYERVELPLDEFNLAAGSSHPVVAESVLVYVSSARQTNWASAECPVPLSYVDCVIAGFYQQFGNAGARRFMQTTSGWDKPLFNDRKDPLYPRAITLTAEEQPLVDSLLAEFTSI